MADENELLSQDEIERLLQGPSAATPPGQGVSGSTPGGVADAPGLGGPPSGPPASAASSPSGSQEQIGPNEFEALVAGQKSPPAPAPGAASSGGAPPPIQDADRLLRQNEIDNLLKEVQGQKGTPPESKLAESAAHPPVPPPAAESDINPRDIELLLNQAERALASVTGESKTSLPPGISEFRLPELSGAPPSTDNATLDLLRDVELEVKIELGRANMYLEEVLKLRRGSVVPLDKLAGDPVDIFVNGRLVARGEVLVLNDNFCVRIAELIAGVGPG